MVFVHVLVFVCALEREIEDPYEEGLQAGVCDWRMESDKTP